MYYRKRLRKGVELKDANEKHTQNSFTLLPWRIKMQICRSTTLWLNLKQNNFSGAKAI